MTNISRDLLGLTPDQKQTAINELIAYFDHERDEKIGVIAAEEILVHVIQGVGKHLYNNGIDDASEMIKQHTEALETDLGALRKIR